MLKRVFSAFVPPFVKVWYWKRKFNIVHPLPMGMQEFQFWADRIISVAQVPGLTRDSSEFCLAGMIMTLKPTEAWVSDGYFINALRKQASTEIAYGRINDIKQALKDKASQPKPVGATTSLLEQAVNESEK
jgi:hypothetical protein